MVPDDPLPALAIAELEVLLAALDPRLDGFGEGESCLDDAVAYLARLGITPAQSPAKAGMAADGAPAEGEPPAEEAQPPLLRWIEGWRAAGGDRRTLRLMVATLLAQQAPAGES